ncbi:hypothetical protein J2Y02_003358 [Neobacillus drentensis]|nr:hypothetical protein [Neobacillus drentensis]
MAEMLLKLAESSSKSAESILTPHSIKLATQKRATPHEITGLALFSHLHFSTN